MRLAIVAGLVVATACVGIATHIYAQDSYNRHVRAWPSESVNLFAFAGQSNAEGHFYRSAKRGDKRTGAEVFADEVETRTGVRPKVLNIAVGGSVSSNQVHEDATSYWWDAQRDRPGPALARAVREIQSVAQDGRTLDAIIWAQGETDAYSVFYNDAARTDDLVSAHQHALEQIFAHLRQMFGPDLPILIQELGYYPVPQHALSEGNAFHEIRSVQSRLIQSQPHIHLGARSNGLPHRDELHFAHESYQKLAQSLAETAVTVAWQKE